LQEKTLLLEELGDEEFEEEDNLQEMFNKGSDTESDSQEDEGEEVYWGRNRVG